MVIPSFASKFTPETNAGAFLLPTLHAPLVFGPTTVIRKNELNNHLLSSTALLPFVGDRLWVVCHTDFSLALAMIVFGW
jgi:hypothetical protein